MAVHESGCEDGFDFVDEWSATAPDRYAGSDDVRKHYDSFTRKPGGITVGTLYKKARDGWLAVARPATEFPLAGGEAHSRSIRARPVASAAGAAGLVYQRMAERGTLPPTGRPRWHRQVSVGASGGPLHWHSDVITSTPSRSRAQCSCGCAKTTTTRSGAGSLPTPPSSAWSFSAFAGKLIILPRRGDENTLLSTVYGRAQAHAAHGRVTGASQRLQGPTCSSWTTWGRRSAPMRTAEHDVDDVHE